MTNKYMKVSMLVALLSSLSFWGCTNTEDTDRSDQCGEEFIPYCLDGSIQVRCNENGMLFQKYCAEGCVTTDYASKASACLGENHCDPACGEGYWCDYNVCKPGEPPVDACGGTCASNEICVNASCRLPGSCSTHADCTAQDASKPVCESGTCVAAPVDSECTTNADCKDASKPVCESGTCVATPSDSECTTNDDCKDASKPVCESGTCVAAPVDSECTTNADCNSWEICEESVCVEIPAQECEENEEFVNGVCVHKGMLAAKPGDPCDESWEKYSYCTDDNHSVYCWRDDDKVTLVKDACEKCQYVRHMFGYIPTCDNPYSALCNEKGDTFPYCDDRMDYGKLSSEYVCSLTMNGGMVAWDQFELGAATICANNTCNADNTSCEGVERCDPATFKDRCTANGEYQYCSIYNEVVTTDCVSAEATCHLVNGLRKPGVVSGGCFAQEQMCETAGEEFPVCKVDDDNGIGVGIDLCTATEDGAFVRIYQGHTALCDDGNGECNDDFTACKEIESCTYGVDNDSCNGTVLKYCTPEGEYKTEDCSKLKMACLTFSDVDDHTIGSCMEPVSCKNEGKLEDRCISIEHRTYSSYCAKAQDGKLYRIEFETEVCGNGYGTCNAEGTACLAVESCDPKTYNDNCTPDGTLLHCNENGGFVESVSCAASGKQCLIIDNYYTPSEADVTSLALGACYAEFDLCNTAGDVQESCFAYNTFQGGLGKKKCYATTTSNINVLVTEGLPTACKYGAGYCNDDFTACEATEAPVCPDDFKPSCVNENVLETCGANKKILRTNCAASDKTCHVIGENDAQCFGECTEKGANETKCYAHATKGTITSEFVCTETADGALYWVETVIDTCAGGNGTCATDGKSCVPAECDPSKYVNKCDGETLVQCRNYKLHESSCEDWGKLCGTVDDVGQCLNACTDADTSYTVCAASGTRFEKRSYTCTSIDDKRLWVEDTDAYKVCTWGCNAAGTDCKEH